LAFYNRSFVCPLAVCISVRLATIKCFVTDLINLNDAVLKRGFYHDCVFSFKLASQYDYLRDKDAQMGNDGNAPVPQSATRTRI
jgi:hypothetical protein